ncbi:MAG: HYR domain-containing protein [Chloroflexota bacterium]
MKRISALLVLIVLLTQVTPALAAPVDLSNNLASTPSGEVALPNQITFIAQSFSTTATHVVITQVSLPMCRYSGTTGNLLVEIYSSDAATGLPGVMLATVSNSVALSDLQQHVSGTACPILDFIPSSGITLNPSTEYYLVVKTTSASTAGWDFTYDEGGTGFPSKYTWSSNSGASWSAASSVDPQMMQIVADEPAVPDTTDPILTLPAADVIAEATGPTGAVVDFSALVSATDETSPTNPGVACTPASNTLFPLGFTEVFCSASDDAGNTANGSFFVNVVDTTGPALELPVDINVDADGPDGTVVNFSYSATDLVSETTFGGCEPASDFLFPVGTTTVFCHVWDEDENSTEGTFDVTVVDTPPTLHLPANITVPQTSSAGAVVTFTATATDLVGPLNPVVTCAPPSGTIFPLGTTTVNCTAWDSAQNMAEGSFTVTVTPATVGVNLLRKPGFDGPYIFPYAWNMYGNSTPLTGPLDCNVASSKPCSVRVTGSRANIHYEVFQKVKRAGLAGDRYSFGISTRTTKVPTAGILQVEVTFYNAWNKPLGTTVLKVTPGTHGFQKYSSVATAPADYTHMVFRFIFRKTTGIAWFDDTFLAPIR